MSERRFQDIWKDQCEAARDVREHHGLVSALDYLVGEKLMTFAETASSRSEFARELPRFVAEIRRMFDADEIRLYLEHLERLQVADEEALAAERVVDDDDLLHSSPEQRAADRERLANLKSLLTLRVLGTA
jgi:5'-deoxynucleotidase YfbR-like HD superfamily hydrolase